MPRLPLKSLPRGRLVIGETTDTLIILRNDREPIVDVLLVPVNGDEHVSNAVAARAVKTRGAVR